MVGLATVVLAALLLEMVLAFALFVRVMTWVRHDEFPVATVGLSLSPAATADRAAAGEDDTVACPSCGVENPAFASYCRECLDEL